MLRLALSKKDMELDNLKDEIVLLKHEEKKSDELLLENDNLRDDILSLQQENKELSDLCMVSTQQNQLNKEQISDLQQQLTEGHSRRLASEEHNQNLQHDLFEQVLPNIARVFVEKVISSSIATERMNKLLHEQLMKQEVQESLEEKLASYEEASEELAKSLTEEYQQKIAMNVTSKSIVSALVQVANDAIHDLTDRLAVEQRAKDSMVEQHDASETDQCDGETMTDMSLVDILEMEDKFQGNEMQEAEHKYQEKISDFQPFSSVQSSETDKCDADTMTDVSWVDLGDMEEKFYWISIQDVEDSLLENHLEEKQPLSTNSATDRCDVEVMTDMSWTDVQDVEDKYQEFQENIQEIQDKLAKVDVDKNNVEVMTDFTWDNMDEQENFYQQQIEDLQHQLSLEIHRVEDEKSKAEEYDELFQEQEQSYQKQTDDLQQQLSEENQKAKYENNKAQKYEKLLKENEQHVEELQQHLTAESQKARDEKAKAEEYQLILKEYMAKEQTDKCCMTDTVEDQLDETISNIVQQSQLEAILELADELTTKPIKNDQVVMTEFSWKEIEYLEKTYREWVEELRLMKKDLELKDSQKQDQMCMTDPTEFLDAYVMTDLDMEKMAAFDMQCSTVVLDKETLTEIDIAKIATSEFKDSAVLQDQSTMTDLDFEKLTALEIKCSADFLDNEAMTDLKWDDITYLETTYMEKLEELQTIAATMEESEHKETNNEESMTDLSWSDVVSLETSYKEELEKITALEESFHSRDVIDEGTMTELNWYEVENQLDDYKDQIEALKEMLEEEKAQRSIEQIQATEAGNMESSCLDELGWAFNMGEIEDDVEVDDILVDSFQETTREVGSMTEVSWKDITIKESLSEKCCSTDVAFPFGDLVIFSIKKNNVEKESATDLSLTDLSNMEDIYWHEIQRMDELKEKQELVDKETITDPEKEPFNELGEKEQKLVDNYSRADQILIDYCTTDQVLIDNTRVNTECMTELSSYDIDQLYKPEHMTTDDKELESNKETDVLTDKFEPKDRHGVGDDFLEDSIRDEKQSIDQETSTEITVDDIIYFEDLEVKHHELLMNTKQGDVVSLDKNGKPLRTDQTTETTLTTDDLTYYEERLQELEKHLESNLNITEDLLESSPYSDSIDAKSDMEQNLDQSKCQVVHQATETDLTEDNLVYFEHLIHELKLENADLKNQLSEKELKNLEDKEVETELTIDDIDMYENEFEEKESKETEDKEVETELTLEDIDMFENSELTWLDYQTQSEQEIESINAKYDDLAKTKNSLQSRFDELQQAHQQFVDRKSNTSEQGVGTELSLEHLSQFEEIVSAHQQAHQQSGKKTRGTSIGVATDLTLAEIHYLEEIDTVHTEYCVNTMDNDTSSKTDSSQKETKAVSTDMTASVLEYLEEVASTHEEIVREYEAFRYSVNKEKNDADTMTEMTGEHLDYLDEMALRSEELENMLIDVTEEAKVKQYEYESKKNVFSKELMTELSYSDISSLESEISRLRQQQRDSRKSVKLTRSGYECLLDIENSENRHDIALMTDMTIDELQSLENSDNIYMDLKEQGLLSRLEDLRKPVSSNAMMTDLLGTNIEDLKRIEKLYNEKRKNKDTMKSKQTETSMTLTDLTRLENTANRNTPEDTITVETSEAVFGSCPREKRGRAGRHGDRGRLASDGNYGNRSVEVGIQCEIKDLMSLVQEQQQKDGTPDSNWYVSALKIKRENKGFDPVEVVLRSGRKSSTPDVSSRDHGNKRNSFIDGKNDTTMASLDYGWQSTMSLDASGLEKTPLKGTALGRWDSPQVPLAQDEVFDLSDIDSAASDESLVTPLRKESAVAKFDRYVMARKESEIELLSNLRDDSDRTDGATTTPRRMADILKENEDLKKRIAELELIISKRGDLSDEELELLKEKIRQLQAAEQKMKELQDSNSALKDRISRLNDDNLDSGASTSRTDQSEGRTRLLLVQDWGLDDTDLESLFSAREAAVSPAESLETSALRRLLDEYAKSDHGTQAGPGPGISQEIQTTGDLVKLIDLSYDGTIPEHIAKELEKLKGENKELYQELLQLRKLKLENSRASNSGTTPRDPIEEPITSSRQTPTESQNDWMTVLGVTEGNQSRRPEPYQPVRDLDDVLDAPPRTTAKTPQYHAGAVKEPKIQTSRSSRDVSATIDRGINNLADMGDSRHRADTADILDFEFDQDGPPEIAPPPVPIQPPPDSDPYGLNNSSNSVFDNSPPRDSKALRAATGRTRNQPGRPGISEATIQPHVGMNVEGQPTSPGLMDIPAPLRVSQTPVQSRPGMARQPPPTLPKPKVGVRRSLSREPDDDSSVGITPRGYVRATASAINQGEVDALNEKINFLEKQVKNKEVVIRSMKTEATEIENKALVERKEREIKILEDDVAYLKQENQKKERDLLAKIGEINRKSYEVDQWKAEATNAEKQRKRIETSYMNLQSQTRNLHGANTKLGDLESKYNSLEKENKQLLDKVNKLEKTEREFKQLEYNIGVLQNHLRDMESVEKERDDLSSRLKVVENQRDDLLKKGRMVESERNDFLHNNKIMEMQRDELEERYAIAHEELMKLKATAGDLEQTIKEAENTSLDAKHECNYLQTQYKKLESDKIELERQLLAVTRERNGLETRLAELEDRNRESLKLEDGFHTLRLKVAELTRQRDEFETQIPTLKAKIALLKRACKEKDDYIDKLNDEIRELRHSIATSTLDDLSKIKYSARKPKESKSPSTKTTPRKSNSFPKRCIALFDYNPQTASVSGQPDKELTLKEGDQLTLLSDMDIHGCYEAELNGMRGLVPGLYVEEVGESPTANGHVTRQRTPVTNGHVETADRRSTTPRSTASDLDKQCFVALHDYNPYQMCTSGRPESELPFKKGDIMAVYGDVDNNGYYHAEMEGQTGLVPSNFVEEVSSSTYLQPQSTSGTAPQQILSMYDNKKGPSPQRPGSSFPLPTPPHSSPDRIPSHPPSVGIVPSSHVTAPVPAMMSPNHVIHGVPSTNGIMPMTVAMTTPRREQTIQPIFTPHMSPAEVQKLAAPLPRPRDKKPSPRQQVMTSKRSPGQPVTSPPRITSQNNSTQPVSKPKARQSKALVSRSQPSSSRGAPNPPSNLHVLRPVNHDAILLGWTLPEMDEFGRSNGTVVKGYKVYENGDYKMDVRSQFMAKALVDDLDLRYPIQFSVRTIGEGDTLSGEASTTFTDTINSSRMSISRAIEGTVGDADQCRTFVALYDYDPLKSSPNSNPQYELQFNEGDILRVEDTSRKDGFFFGSLNGKKGLIPSNFIEEVAVAKTKGPSSPTRKHQETSIPNGRSPSPRHRIKMIALYDYNPNEQSPLKNTQSELSFKKGQTITVLGPMNKDGFYNAAIDGRQGLVPASFLESSLEISPANQRPPRSA